MDETPSFALLNEIVDRVSVGILVVNKDYELVLWNNYMENYSQKKAEDIVGANIFTTFPDLPKSWLEQKIRNVFILKNFSFTSWEHRPYLFKFFHNRPITGGIDYMRQNCTFLPIKGESGDIEYVCITLLDVTDTSIYEGMLKSAVKSLAESSNRDGLTNIYNRRFLEQSMSKEFARIKRYGGTLSFIIIDLDHFKKINDNYGHLAGDEILKIASKRIGECLRESDVLARYGGEEFAVMLPETPLQGADILANRLCKHLAKDPVFYNDIEIHISASLGVAEFQPNLENHEQLISRADSVLYVSKENGRNRVTVFDHNNPDNFSHEQNIEKSTDKEQPNSTEAELSEATPSITSSSENAPSELDASNMQQSTEDNLQMDTTPKSEEPNESDMSVETNSDATESIEKASVTLETNSEDLAAPEPVETTQDTTIISDEIHEEIAEVEPELEAQSIKTENKTDETELPREEAIEHQTAEVPIEAVADSSDAEAAPEESLTNDATAEPPLAEETKLEEESEAKIKASPSSEEVNNDTQAEEAISEEENTQAIDEQLEQAETSELIEASDIDSEETSTTEESIAKDTAEAPLVVEEFGAEIESSVSSEDIAAHEQVVSATMQSNGEDNNQVDDEQLEQTETNEKDNEENEITEDQKELSAEEKADLAMIAAFGKELEEENSSATIIDMNSATNSNPPAEAKDVKIKQETIYVKLGSK